MTDGLPAARCSMMCAHTVCWRVCFLPEFAWLQSTISVPGRPASRCGFTRADFLALELRPNAP
jgi:hypothetical protein